VVEDSARLADDITKLEFDSLEIGIDTFYDTQNAPTLGTCCSLFPNLVQACLSSLRLSARLCRRKARKKPLAARVASAKVPLARHRGAAFAPRDHDRVESFASAIHHGIQDAQNWRDFEREASRDDDFLISMGFGGKRKKLSPLAQLEPERSAVQVRQTFWESGRS
jgi:hypothetical protein